MQEPAALRFTVACLVMGGLVAVNCSVNDNGLGAGGQSGGGAGVVASGGRGTGGTTPVGAGGRPGTGGAPVIAGTGGAQAATGGATATSTGGVLATGGTVPTGGVLGTGGDPAATGGMPATGGDPGSSGGAGGAPIGGMGVVPGTGGSMVPGTGGATASCNPDSCPNGCCNAEGRCVAGTTNNRCGTAGAACVTCGACFSCAAGACAVVPTSRWEVMCASATIAPTKLNGQPWDATGMGLPDPLCRSLTPNGGPDVSTDAEVDTLTPMWDAPITPTSIMSGSGGGRATAAGLIGGGMMNAPRWGVSVVDVDANGGASEPICAAVPRLTLADFSAGTVSIPAVGSCLTLTLRLACAE